MNTDFHRLGKVVLGGVGRPAPNLGLVEEPLTCMPIWRGRSGKGLPDQLWATNFDIMRVLALRG